MPALAPPYALDTFQFRFVALASCAGRAPLGGDREMSLGMLVAARLAAALLPPISLSDELRSARADHARHWLTSLTMPNPARMALLRAFDGSIVGPMAAADALTELARTVTGHVDAPALREVTELVALLRVIANPNAPPQAPLPTAALATSQATS